MGQLRQESNGTGNAATTPEELIDRLYRHLLFIEGLSYALNEDAAKRLRSTSNDMYMNVKKYFKLQEIQAVE
jgi:hypothetical protein